MNTLKIVQLLQILSGRHLQACVDAGQGHLNADDIADSRKFMRKVFREQLQEAEGSGKALVAAGGPPYMHPALTINSSTVCRSSSIGFGFHHTCRMTGWQHVMMIGGIECRQPDVTPAACKAHGAGWESALHRCMISKRT